MGGKSKANDMERIPWGPYCYKENRGRGTPKEICPFWEKHLERPDGLNGYCRFIEAGDWEIPGGGLLFDQIKECDQKLIPPGRRRKKQWA
mgnify:CR=1 FL=1